MIRSIRIAAFLTVAALFVVFVAVPGCQPTKKNDPVKDKEKEKDKGKEKDKDGHGHGETGPRTGGPIVEWEPYHAEVSVDHANKMAIIYILDEKLEKAPDVEATRFSRVKLTITSEKPNVTVELMHDAQKSGPMGIVFTGTNEFFAKPTAFDGDLSATFDEKEKGKKPTGLTGDVKYDPKKHDGKKGKSASIRHLYLTPGGIYTAMDIKANGNTTAADKFRGKTWEHADKKPGDKICPITKNKAEAECAWVVQDQRYEFCCPPCVDKFVRYAHFEPEKVKDAKEYVFKGM